MSATRVTAKTKIFELGIVLEAVQPLVQRRVQVPGEVSLAVLHEVVQASVGWTNSHLHEFEIAWAPLRDTGSGLGRPERRRRGREHVDQPGRAA